MTLERFHALISAYFDPSLAPEVLIALSYAFVTVHDAQSDSNPPLVRRFEIGTV